MISKKARAWFRAIHRDVGYFLSALVVAYSISGAAVNHIDDWNPSYSIDFQQVAIGPMSGDMDAMQAAVVQRLELDPSLVKGRHQLSPSVFIVFLKEGGEARVDPTTGKGELKLVQARRPLYDFNVLHLNHIKGAWTWFADGIALMLLILALTGLVMLRGSLGFAGRGKWFVLAGIVTPAAFLAAHYMSQ